MERGRGGGGRRRVKEGGREPYERWGSKSESAGENTANQIEQLDACFFFEWCVCLLV